MADLYSREQVIKNLEQLHQNYKTWQECLTETRIYGNYFKKNQFEHDLAYCKGILAGLSRALAYLKFQDTDIK